MKKTVNIEPIWFMVWGIFCCVSIRLILSQRFLVLRARAGYGFCDFNSLSVAIPAATPGIRLTAIHPNPFNPRTTISFVVDRPQRVEISLFDMAGRIVARVADRHFEAGSHAVAWQGRDAAGRALPSGTYLLRLRGADRAVAGKIMLLR